MLSARLPTLAVQVDGCDIAHRRRLAPAPDRLSVLQDAFRRHHALQCGFCTAGILMSLDAFLREHPDADEDEIRDILLGGHLCRCTGYTPIVRGGARCRHGGYIASEETTHA